MKRRRGRAKSLPLSTRKGQIASRSMITRRAASKAATNSSEGSSTSADSRRSSFADSTHAVGGDDIDSSRPAKRARRTSTATENRPVTRRQKTLSQEPIGSPEKSSRDSLAPELPTIEEPENIDDHVRQPAMNGNGDQDQDGFASEAGEKLSPLPKRRGRKPKPKTVTASLSRLQELTAPWDNENGTDHEGSNAPSRATSRAPSRAPDRVAKRMPGRRRAPHADPNIEADLRRQLQLRLAYRSVAKALKPLLAELSQRGIDALEDDEEAHQQGEEYTAVMAELDARLQSRLTVLENERRIKTGCREEWLELQKDELQRRFHDRVEVLKDDYHTKAENCLLELHREFAREIDDDATEDEDGVVGPQHGKISTTNPTGRLDHKFDSRSRFFLVTEKLANERLKQIAMQNLQRDFIVDEDHDETAEELDAPDENEYPSGFGLASTGRRAYATSVLNMEALVRATQAVEDGEQPEEQIHHVIPNGEATGLQILADLLTSQGPLVLPTRELSRMQTPPPLVVVKQEAGPVEHTVTAPRGGGDEDVVDLTTPQRKQRESGEDIFSALEQNLNLYPFSPQKTIKLETNAASHTTASPAKKKHERKQSQQSLISSPKPQKTAVAAQAGFQIPGLQIPGSQPMEQVHQQKQASFRTQDTKSSEVPSLAPEASKTLQNSSAPITGANMHILPKHNDCQLDARSAQPPAAGTNRPEPKQPFAFTDAPRSPAPTAPASRWDSLYEQNRRGSRNDIGTAGRHDYPTRASHDRRLSESVRPSTNQHSDANLASVPAHRRNMSIPAKVSSPASFLKRSQSPRVTDAGRRGYMSLITDLAPTQRAGSPSSGSQSAVDGTWKREQPPPGSWHGGQHRNSHSTSQNYTPPPPSHRRTPPMSYPPVSASTSGPAYQHQPPYTTGPPHHPIQPQPHGPYSGPYQAPPPPSSQYQYQQPQSTATPPYDHRTPNPYLPSQPQSQQQTQHQQQNYVGGAPHYQLPPAPMGFFAGPPLPSAGPPPPGSVFSPRFGREYPPSHQQQRQQPSSVGGPFSAGSGSGQRPSSPRNGGVPPPPVKDGSDRGGREDGWSKAR
ncbi:hypothetical protein E2P81_ATG07474 [Venturia nashicola]|uniref:Uncharacterized protein n=1 Tax=Venturia nashicola TaxID=86259 RepID=A0A4Z1P6N7_9PEZI|nr:hypothetical protein E6O75_ATG07630 [Venturia nashicola]TLD31984.1 hypothetical protein E2P81_ATG07474 [Venturia nashicola]